MSSAGSDAWAHLLLVLHAHLPYVRHPEHDDFLEEDWLFEACIETYAPLLRLLQQARDRGRRIRVTFTLSPSLCEMLADPLLRGRFQTHLDKLRELVQREVARHPVDSAFGRTARMYDAHLAEVDALAAPEGLLPHFRDLQDSGHIEIITCAATHGLLPLMSGDQARRAQIAVGVSTYTRHFGRPPAGIWLPECAYTPGLDEELERHGLRYFFMDSHGLLLGHPQPRYGIHAPVQTPAGPCAFARDPESGRQVWSAAEGYPGDPWYREFYRDLGYDGPYELVRPYLHSDGVRRNLGLKYHRVTGDVPLHEKAPYEPERARERVREHAAHFVEMRRRQAAQLAGVMDRPPVVVATYDAELFGHWWFEGPAFLDEVVARLDALASTPGDDPRPRLMTASDALDEGPAPQAVTPNASSWGAEGYYRVWLNGETAWMYRHQHRAERRMNELAERFTIRAQTGQLTDLERRALNQASRELLLAQSSDWAFIISGQTSTPYAVKRFRSHIDRFNRLYDQLLGGHLDREYLMTLELRDAAFPDIDFQIYSPNAQD